MKILNLHEPRKNFIASNVYHIFLWGMDMTDSRDTECDILDRHLPHQSLVKGFTLDDIKGLCIKHVPQWNNLSVNDIKVLRMGGGTINYVFNVSTRIENDRRNVICRFFNPGLAYLIDRDNEIEAFKAASDLGIGARQITLFEFSGRKGRIEEFLPGQNLTFDQYIERDICLLVARELARYSRLMTPKLNHWPHKPELSNYLTKHLDYCTKHPIHTQCFNEKTLREEAEEYLELLDKRVATGRYAFKLALCHNDPHLFNILYEEATTTLKLVDYEFASFNYHGYNLASYMCETIVDYRSPNRFPYFTVHTYSDFPEDIALEMAKAYLDESGVGYDNKFLNDFINDIRFIQVGWWLARVLFNCIISIAVNREQRAKRFIIYANLCHDTYRIKRQDAIHSGNWYI